MTEEEALSARCADIADLGDRAVDWLNDPANADRVGSGTRSRIKTLRRVGRRARKLSRAARTRMSVSVFGPSQAGKSFLVSVLARPKDGELFSAYDDPAGTLEYLKEVNPEGEGESTGLVTRFTMVRSKTPPGFPIKLTLLSEADIVCTLLNSFFNDGDGSEPPLEPQDIRAHFDRFQSRAGGVADGLTPDDVLEIGEYVDRMFASKTYASSLRSLWEDAADLVPRLSRADRQAFFAILWGGHQSLSQLYRTLADALAELGHAEVVYAGLDALTPRDTSIIDVKTLKGLSGEDVGPALALRTDGGQTVRLARGVLCALAAELEFPMQTQPSEVFGRTDLLDFPGARNRFDAPLSTTLGAHDAEDNLREMLLRGKVAYLFDRYVENQEITSMLLCIPDSNMETVSLPGLVENWIALTHGATPAARAAVETVLFFVLTKFDKLLVDSGGADSGAMARFQRRMEASLLEKFTKGRDKWVTEWTRGQPFNNCFWLRNPKYPADSVITYEDKRETGYRQDRAGRLAELKAGSLQSEHVQRHFADPEAAWDAALALNDGGVTYLTEALTRVARPDSKLRQIAAQMAKLCQDAANEISEFYISDDIETRITEKRISAGRLTDGIDNCIREQLFGSFLSELSLDQDVLETRIARVPSTVRIRSAGGAGAPPTPGAVRPAGADQAATSSGLRRPGGLRRPDALPGQTARPEPLAAVPETAPDPSSRARQEVRSMSMEAFQAETAIELWLDRLKAFRDDPRATEIYGFDQTALGDLVAELTHAARRLGLVGRIAQQLAVVNFGLSASEQASPAAIIASEAVNTFIAQLDAANMPPDARPQVPEANGTTRTAFSDRPRHDTADRLPATMFDAALAHAEDWVFMLEAVFVANAMDTGSGTANPEQNLALGRILDGLRQPEAEGAHG